MDHGSLTGLTDDDHPQYHNDARGDVRYAPLVGRTQIKTGTYTGDGAVSQAITGVGFRPKYVRIWQRQTIAGTLIITYETTDTIIDDHANGGSVYNGASGANQQLAQNAIISLDADGFTVDDAGLDYDPNKNGQVYNYMAMGY